MTQPRLNHVILLHMYKETTDKLNLVSIVTKFVPVNDRRSGFFWKSLIYFIHYLDNNIFLLYTG